MTPSTSTGERTASPEWSVPHPIRAGAFWMAVLLPFCVLLLLASGVETTREYGVLISLLTANVAALVVGHGYGAE